MHKMSASDDRYRENMKNAAEFLLKGGTLLSEPCEKCSGIQVKKNDEIKCIICGNTVSPADNKTKEIVFRNVNVIPMDKEQVLMNQDVVVKDGKIEKEVKNLGLEHDLQ